MEMAEIAGWAGGILLVVRLVPQMLHIRRNGAAGISRAGLWCWLGNDFAWLMHGWRQDLDPLTVSSAVLIVLDLVLIKQTRGNGSRNEVAGHVWAAAMVAGASAVPQALPALLAVASVTGTLPHALDSIRSPDVSGISPLAWRIAMLDGALWLVYGTSESDGPVVLYALLTLLTSTIILARIQAGRLGQNARNEAPPAEQMPTRKV